MEGRRKILKCFFGKAALSKFRLYPVCDFTVNEFDFYNTAKK